MYHLRTEISIMTRNSTSRFTWQEHATK